MFIQSGISFIMWDGFTIMNGLLVGYILIPNSKQNQINEAHLSKLKSYLHLKTSHYSPQKVFCSDVSHST